MRSLWVYSLQSSRFNRWATHSYSDMQTSSCSRSIAAEIERTALAANALALAQAWSWLAIVALFAIREQRGRTLLWYVCLVMLLTFHSSACRAGRFPCRSFSPT